MSAWTISTNNELAVKKWMEKLFRWTRKDMTFAPFMSDSPDSMIYEKTDLTKSKGDKITYGIAAPLLGDGFGEGENVKGNEADLTTYSGSVSLVRRRNAIKHDNHMSQQRVLFSMDDVGALALKEWAGDYLDRKIMDALTTSPTKSFFGGTATDVNGLGANDKITPALLSKARSWARSQGSDPKNPRNIIRPIMIKGKKYYVALLSTGSMYDMKRNSEYLQNLREAMTASDNHPIFTGASGLTHDGVIMYECDLIPVKTNTGSVKYSQNLLLGAQAAVVAWGERPKIITDKDDYDEYTGKCIGLTYGVQKVNFNSSDYGVVSIYTSSTDIG